MRTALLLALCTVNVCQAQNPCPTPILKVQTEPSAAFLDQTNSQPLQTIGVHPAKGRPTSSSQTSIPPAGTSKQTALIPDQSD